MKKKLNLAVVLALGLVVPAGAMATTPDAEVTIRVMEMHEKSTASVMNRIKLPDVAVDKVAAEETYRKGLSETKGNGETEQDSSHDEDQEQIHEQEQDREIELIQEQIRDTEHEFEKGTEITNGTGTK